MSSGKDDLMKEKQNRENMMKNGAAKMKTLGFSDCERTQGKRNTIGTPPQPRDIYGIYLASQKGIAVKGKSVDGFCCCSDRTTRPWIQDVACVSLTFCPTNSTRTISLGT